MHDRPRPPVVLVSNRLPVTITVQDGEPVIGPSSGGLASALASVAKQPDTLWIGWPGELREMDAARKQKIDRALAARGLSAVSVPAKEFRAFYEGFSNSVLWPLLHYLVDKVHLDADRWWSAYEKVNERFAQAIAERAPHGAIVWIHDYQLMLVPAMLRALRSDVRIGFFLHVPFPTHEVFRILPWREELLRGLLGADLLGFHTQSYQHNFAVTVAHVLGTDVDAHELAWDGRSVKLDAFPISIDVDHWRAGAQSPSAVARAEELRAGARGRKIVLGVDRLDYTKGIPRRLMAIERFLQRYPALSDKIQVVQVAVPSRESVDAYQDYRRVVDALVGRINGAFGTADRVPIHLLHKGVDFDELCALYRAADVMLVTPLRDGMNLVAKEYCVATGAEDGALILSEFAGAADELSDALLVNPYDVDSVADAIARALEMDASERVERMTRLTQTVEQSPVSAWAERFVEALLERRSTDAWTFSAAPPPLDRAHPVQWLLDYDGTLVSFADRPERATADTALRLLLARMCAIPWWQVHIVSGRPGPWLAEQLAGLPLAIHGEHGAVSRAAGQTEWRSHIDHDSRWKSLARQVIADTVGDLDHGLVEEKQLSLAWHYRRVLPEVVAERMGTLRARLEAFARAHELSVLEGAKVVELKPLGASKASVIARVVEDPQATTVVLIGDDRTDEEMFAAASPQMLTIKVGRGASRARFRLDSVEAVHDFIEREIERAKGATR